MPIRTPDDDESLPVWAMEELRKALAPFMGGDLTSGSLIRMDTAVYDACVRIRQKGFRIPRMGIVFVERFGEVSIVRRDLEHVGIQRVIQNLMQRCFDKTKKGMVPPPPVQPQELALAIRRAFPAYHFDDAGKEAARVEGALKLKNPGIILPRA